MVAFREVTMRGSAVVLLAVLVVGAAACARKQGPVPTTLEAIRAGLPAEVGGWAANPEDDGLYDPESIYGYIDGHAEVYLAYGMTGCLSRRWQAPDGRGELVLDVFRLGSADDAWGAFRREADGEPVAAIGQEARLRPGWLCARKGPFLLSVWADSGAAEEQLLLAVARDAVAGIAEDGAEPELVTALPMAGRDEPSVRFLRGSVLLSAEVPLAGDDLLGLGRDAAVALARYRRSSGEAVLVVVDYPARDRAAAAYNAVIDRLPPDARTGQPAVNEDGMFEAVRVDGKRMALVVAATSSEVAGELATEALPASGGAR
jgi:hypothetical protein